MKRFLAPPQTRPACIEIIPFKDGLRRARCSAHKKEGVHRQDALTCFTDCFSILQAAVRMRRARTWRTPTAPRRHSPIQADAGSGTAGTSSTMLSMLDDVEPEPGVTK